MLSRFSSLFIMFIMFTKPVNNTNWKINNFTMSVSPWLEYEKTFFFKGDCKKGYMEGGGGGGGVAIGNNR